MPRPWDQQWSLRMQQVLAFESDLLEYGDIFEGSVVIEAKTAELAEAAVGGAGRRGGARRRLRGDRRAEAPAGAQPGRAGAAHRVGRAEGGRRQLLHRDRALAARSATASSTTSSRSTTASRPSRSSEVERWRADRDAAAVRAALDELRRVADDDGPGGNIMEATIALAHAGGTTGEWAGALREVFGEFRAPTGVSGGVGRRGDRAGAASGCAPRRWPSARVARRACSWPSPASTATPTAPSRSRWRPATPASR